MQWRVSYNLMDLEISILKNSTVFMLPKSIFCPTGKLLQFVEDWFSVLTHIQIVWGFIL